MKVLAADGISPKGIELLQKDFEVVVKDKLPAEELLEIIPDFDALIVRSASKVTAEVIARADLVTEMHLVKHPFSQGVKAQRGIEF